MTQANDIAGLFKKLGTSPELYQELVRQNEVQKSRERWPLLSAIQANEPAPPPVGVRREAVRQAPPQAVPQPQPVHFAPAAAAPVTGYPAGIQYDPPPARQPQMGFAPQPPAQSMPHGLVPQPSDQSMPHGLVPQPSAPSMPQGFAPQPFVMPGAAQNPRPSPSPRDFGSC